MAVSRSDFRPHISGSLGIEKASLGCDPPRGAAFLGKLPIFGAQTSMHRLAELRLDVDC
jgi:hypothetical protein